MSNIKRLNNATKKAETAENNNLIAHKQRKWIEDTPKINILNYWYYRYFTNDFELYLMKERGLMK